MDNRLARELRTMANTVAVPGYQLGPIRGGIAGLLEKAARRIEDSQRADSLNRCTITFELPGRTYVDGEGYLWEPERWWDTPRVGELVNLPPHDRRAYVNVHGKALYRVKQVEYVRDGEVIIRVEGPLNG